MIFRNGVTDVGLKASLVMFLELAERLGNVQFEITSAAEQREDGEHAEGWAVDIAVKGSAQRRRVFDALTAAGFRRIGLYDKHIHAGRSLSRPIGYWPGVSK